jgi:hypothetical protein
MLLIHAVTITIERTRPHPQLTFRWQNIWVAGGVGQVCAKVDFTFGLVA